VVSGTSLSIAPRFTPSMHRSRCIARTMGDGARDRTAIDANAFARRLAARRRWIAMDPAT
jgi:hypothetical protein